jgi:hypothetical protein
MNQLETTQWIAGWSTRALAGGLLVLSACGAPVITDGSGDTTSDPLAGCAVLPLAGVTASGNDGNLPANAIDGNLATRWSSLGIGQFITVDLGVAQNICNTSIAWYVGNQRVSTFAIGVSKDGTTFTQVFSGKTSGTTTALETYDFPDTVGRYVRVTVNGNTQNQWASITEIRVAGGSPASNTTETLFGTRSPAASDAADADTAAVELGVKFQAAVAGRIQGIRFYRAVANAAGYSVHLFDGSGKLLASASGSDGVLPGWQEIKLSSPIAISANTLYVASYFTSNGRYAGTNEGCATSLTSGDLSAPVNAGVYHYGPSAFPSSTYQGSNYWVDVSFLSQPSGSGVDGGVAHSVALAWNASSTPGVTYNLYRGATQGGPYTRIASALSALNATDSAVSSATTYYYVIRAQNGGGESTSSNEIKAVIP